MNNIIDGIELFNNGDFFAAHDFFEDVWMECSNNERLFFQGLVQVSVGSFHLSSGNIKGALSQYKKAQYKLEKYLPDHNGINISQLLSEIDLLLIDLNNSYIKIDSRIILKKIPKIKFT